ncbi:hypothetical protein PF004_g14663 [Phytophthora fragariae]|uniref:RxLR effector protein n=1 Tax=Phytophthora fragariae TaxID=53985 RepID=A0A6G0NNL3_9STRA|nr:hypothetical protein PF003_g25142 [Phytophthora fragariae]KAE9215718.1 hypothetical protein PF004_g14663 [Phytophthora fragariae]
MQKASFLAALVLAIAGPASFAAGQDTTKAMLFLGESQNLADSVICLNGYYRRRLEDIDDRRLEVTGKSQVQDIACVNEPWGLQCN